MGDLKIGSLVLSLSLISLFAKEDHSHPASTMVSGQEVGCCGTAGGVMKPTGNGGKNNVILSFSEALKITGFIFSFLSPVSHVCSDGNGN